LLNSLLKKFLKNNCFKQTVSEANFSQIFIGALLNSLLKKFLKNNCFKQTVSEANFSQIFIGNKGLYWNYNY